MDNRNFLLGGGHIVLAPVPPRCLIIVNNNIQHRRNHKHIMPLRVNALQTLITQGEDYAD